MKQTIITSAIVAAVLAGLIGFGFRFSQPTTQPVVQSQDQFGAVTGPTLPSCVVWGGQTVCNLGSTLAATSSVVCAFQAPATSTIDTIGFKVTGNTLGATQTVDVSTSTSRYASSSPQFIKAFSVSASPGVSNPDTVGWQAGTVATTSPWLGMQAQTNGASPYFLKTGDWVTWRIATGTPTANTGKLTGQCSITVSVI